MSLVEEMHRLPCPFLQALALLHNKSCSQVKLEAYERGRQTEGVTMHEGGRTVGAKSAHAQPATVVLRLTGHRKLTPRDIQVIKAALPSPHHVHIAGLNT